MRSFLQSGTVKRVVPMLLLPAAVVIYFGWLSPGASREFRVTLRLQGAVDRIEQIQTLWTPVQSDSTQPVAGSTFRYAKGKAPRDVQTKLQAPAGEYWVEITISENAEQTTRRRKVNLQAENTVLFVDTPRKSDADSITSDAAAADSDAADGDSGSVDSGRIDR